MRSVVEAGSTRELSDLSRVVGKGCRDDGRRADLSQAEQEYAPTSQARFRVRIEKSGRKPVDLLTVEPLLTRSNEFCQRRRESDQRHGYSVSD